MSRPASIKPAWGAPLRWAVWRARLLRCGSVLPLLLTSDGEPSLVTAPCTASSVNVEVYSGSRLLQVSDERLELRHGQRLDCQGPHAEAVLTALDAALQSFPRDRFDGPVRVHVDPRLPAGQAPLRSIEVHVSSREILVTRTALSELPPSVWRHELFHTLAPPPPRASLLARRLWLTLEEGLVTYMTSLSGPSHPPQVSQPRDVSGPEAPAWEELALPQYDPHGLAESLSRELEGVEPRLELLDVLACLRSTSAPEVALQTLRESARRFVSRCPSRVRTTLAAAVARWLPEPLSPWLDADTGRQTSIAPPRH